ncbi:hypothetical protein HK097_010521 [Rhizophlyctis rosea]|uniref:Uncharacterized protein n=1 Tax=Rhizophlyctis rosea TaxID=64517 RepID=A0AAD5SKB8_9FUNG|nr:hypothetical protein HK097_010521 [Rhizophlyctis rosea]
MPDLSRHRITSDIFRFAIEVRSIIRYHPLLKDLVWCSDADRCFLAPQFRSLAVNDLEELKASVARLLNPIFRKIQPYSAKRALSSRANGADRAEARRVWAVPVVDVLVEDPLEMMDQLMQRGRFVSLKKAALTDTTNQTVRHIITEPDTLQPIIPSRTPASDPNNPYAPLYDLTSDGDRHSQPSESSEDLDAPSTSSAPPKPNPSTKRPLTTSATSSATTSPSKTDSPKPKPAKKKKKKGKETVDVQVEVLVIDDEDGNEAGPGNGTAVARGKEKKGKKGTKKEKDGGVEITDAVFTSAVNLLFLHKDTMRNRGGKPTRKLRAEVKILGVGENDVERVVKYILRLWDSRERGRFARLQVYRQMEEFMSQ